MTADLERLYTLAEAAVALQVSSDDVDSPERWLRDLVRKHRLPFVKVGRTVKLPYSTLLRIRSVTTVADHPFQGTTAQPSSTRDVLARLEKSKPRKQ